MYRFKSCFGSLRRNYKHLGPEYIHLPRAVEEMQRKVSQFELKFGMIEASVCIDGTHAPIKTPSTDSHDYFCYKQYYSLNVQAVYDYRGMFIDVDCRWSGCVHDANVFANSTLNHRMRTGSLPQTCNMLSNERHKVPNYVIGDPAYPLTSYCMKELESCTINAQVLFNELFRSAHSQIECAFGRLKARWSILTRKIDLNTEMVPTVVNSCFVLHNFCESRGGSLDEEAVEAQVRRNQIQEDIKRAGPLYFVIFFLVIVHVFSPNPNFLIWLNIAHGLDLLILYSSELIERMKWKFKADILNKTLNPSFPILLTI